MTNNGGLQLFRTHPNRYKDILRRVLIAACGAFAIGYIWAMRGPVFGIAGLIGLGPMIIAASPSALVRWRSAIMGGMPRQDAAQGRQTRRPAATAKKVLAWLLVLVMPSATIFATLGLKTHWSTTACALFASATLVVAMVVGMVRAWQSWRYASRAAKRAA